MSREADNPAYEWRRQGRGTGTAMAVAAVWALLGVALVALDAAWWVVGVLALFTLPALHDLATNPRAGLSLGDHRLCWFSGLRSASVGLAEIDHIRLETRLDFSVRATAVLSSGEKLRLPFESTPPHREFETACRARGLKVVRHHFSPLV